jgi:cephalosporin hydroxylase
MKDFQQEITERLAAMRDDDAMNESAAAFMHASITARYSYNFHWLDRPVIQYPQDIVALQEVIWQVKPDLVIETGIAHGGSLVLTASLLALLDYADAAAAGEMLDPSAPRRKVLGVDIDIRAHNRAALDAHPMRPRIEMIEGSSIDPKIASQVHARAQGAERVLVVLDSNHTHDHVLGELRLYAPLVSPSSYCIVLDTLVEDLPADMFQDRPWGPGNNPKTAVHAFISEDPSFEIDRTIHERLLITAGPDGYLRKQAP